MDIDIDAETEIETETENETETDIDIVMDMDMGIDIHMDDTIPPINDNAQQPRRYQSPTLPSTLTPTESRK